MRQNIRSDINGIAGKYLSPVRRENMRLLEIGMGCSMHNGVEGMHSLSVSVWNDAIDFGAVWPAGILLKADT